MTERPGGWRIEWSAESSPKTERRTLALRERDHKRGSLSREVWRKGPGAVLVGTDTATPTFPLSSLPVRLGLFPSLDELWCLYMLTRGEAAAQPRYAPAHWEAMVGYVENARLGYVLDKVPTELAILPVYQAIVHQHLAGESTARDAFLDDALALCACIDERLQGGIELLTNQHFNDDPRFARYLAMLTADQALYREDLVRGQRFAATLPVQGASKQKGRPTSLVVLDTPTATQFKVWARRDPAAPGGDGYGLMLVKDERGYVLSADPLKRIKVDWLAPGLTELEQQHRGQEPWYDGARHEGTLIASPRSGSMVPLDEIVGHLRGVLALRKPPSTSAPRAWLLGASVVTGVAGLALATMFWFRSSPAPLTIDAKGDPLPTAKVKAVSAIVRERPKYALVAGACAYAGTRELRSPCRDARDVRQSLIDNYGYRSDDIIYLVDKPLPGEPNDGEPTARNLKGHVEQFRARFGDHAESSFLFFYSGHGGYIDGAQADYGVLQPTGFFDRFVSEPYSNRGWDMQTFVDDIKKGVPSKHLMLIVDACYSGWAGAKRTGELDAQVRSLWSEPTEVILSAASKGQVAFDDDDSARWRGHSALTEFLLRGLSVNTDGHADADGNADGVITDEEVAAYVQRTVPPAVAAVKQQKQTPQFFRIDQRLRKRGQFLLVPKPKQ